MAAESRSLAEIAQDVFRNVQEIVRLEVSLAKAEAREELIKAKASALTLGIGAVTGVYAMLFLLFAAVHALTLFMPNWAATLLVGGVLAVIATITLTNGVKQFKQIHPTPERTVETIKENIEWAKQQAK
jgi:hypothetical protein